MVVAAAVPAAAAAAPKEVLSVPASLLSEFIETAVLQHFDVVRAAKAVQCEESVDLHPKMGWSIWQALAASLQRLQYNPASEDPWLRLGI